MHAFSFLWMVISIVLYVGCWLANRGCKNCSAEMCSIISMAKWEDFSFKICTCKCSMIQFWSLRSTFQLFISKPFIFGHAGTPREPWTWLDYIHYRYLLFTSITWSPTGILFLLNIYLYFRTPLKFLLPWGFLVSMSLLDPYQNFKGGGLVAGL